MNGQSSLAYGADGVFRLFGDDYLETRFAQTSNPDGNLDDERRIIRLLMSSGSAETKRDLPITSLIHMLEDILIRVLALCRNWVLPELIYDHNTVGCLEKIRRSEVLN